MSPFSICISRFIFIIFILCSFHARGDEAGWDLFQEEAVEQHSLSSTEGIISSVIARHVSAISGEFIDHAIDCTLAGPEPLTLERSYSSHPSVSAFGFEPFPLDPQTVELGDMHCSWQFNHLTRLHIQIDETNHVRHAEATAFVPHAFYSQMLHRSQVKMSKGAFKEEEYSLPLNFHKGVTNCSSGAISGRTNPKNVSANFRNEFTECDVIFGSGNKRHYEGFLKDQIPYFTSWKFSPKYERKANGNQILYQKRHIMAQDSSGKTLFSELKFNWKSKEELQNRHQPYEAFDLSLQADEGKKITVE